MATTKWPTLDEQLRAARAPKGSALETFIKSHQDFHLLDPSEASDDLPLPLWIRVWWRKEHPELKPQADPRGAYPLMLFNIRDQMIAHPDHLFGKKGGTP